LFTVANLVSGWLAAAKSGSQVSAAGVMLLDDDLYESSPRNHWLSAINTAKTIVTLTLLTNARWQVSHKVASRITCHHCCMESKQQRN